MSLEVVREAMGTALRTITVNSRPLYATPYITDKVIPPHAMIECEIDYDLTFGRTGDLYRFTVMVFAQRDSEREGQRYLDGLRDPSSTSSIKQTLETNATLDAVVEYARVVRAGRPAIASVGNVDYLMIEFEVEVAT